jgi:hypothetical protein
VELGFADNRFLKHVEGTRTASNLISLFGPLAAMVHYYVPNNISALSGVIKVDDYFGPDFLF